MESSRAGNNLRLIGRWIGRLFLMGLGGIGSVLLFQFLIMPLVVRHGREVIVPDLRGLPGEDVPSALAEISLRTGLIRETVDDHIPAGRVLQQNPPPDSQVKVGREVDLIISLGCRQALVPQLEGESIVHSRFLLARDGITVGRIRRVQSQTIPPDHVVATSPPVGCSLTGRTEVDLLVSEGIRPEVYLMADFTGQDAGEIETMLTNKGFIVERKIWPGSNSQSTRIIEQTPPPGYPIELSGTIEIITGG